MWRARRGSARASRPRSSSSFAHRRCRTSPSRRTISAARRASRCCASRARPPRTSCRASPSTASSRSGSTTTLVLTDVNVVMGNGRCRARTARTGDAGTPGAASCAPGPVSSRRRAPDGQAGRPLGTLRSDGRVRPASATGGRRRDRRLEATAYRPAAPRLACTCGTCGAALTCDFIPTPGRRLRQRRKERLWRRPRRARRTCDRRRIRRRRLRLGRDRHDQRRQVKSGDGGNGGIGGAGGAGGAGIAGRGGAPGRCLHDELHIVGRGLTSDEDEGRRRHCRRHRRDGGIGGAAAAAAEVRRSRRTKAAQGVVSTGRHDVAHGKPGKGGPPDAGVGARASRPITCPEQARGERGCAVRARRGARRRVSAMRRRLPAERGEQARARTRARDASAEASATRGRGGEGAGRARARGGGRDRVRGRHARSRGRRRWGRARGRRARSRGERRRPCSRRRPSPSCWSHVRHAARRAEEDSTSTAMPRSTWDSASSSALANAHHATDAAHASRVDPRSAGRACRCRARASRSRRSSRTT